MKPIKILTLAGMLGLAVGCGNKKTEETAAEKLPEVAVTKAITQDMVQQSTYTSSVEAYAINNIAPQSSGRIQKINVEVGDFVKAGQTLAEMDQVNLEQAELQMKNNEIEYERLKGLYEAGGLSKSDLDAIELRYEVSKTTYENLLENTVLTSPISGVVSARNYDRGDMFTGEPIYTVQQISPVKLNVGISESDYTKIKKGDSVQITVDAFPGETFEGKVNRLDPTVDFTTHTVNIEVLVANSNLRLRPGMYARVTIVMGVNHSVVIPDTCVQKQTGSGEKYVYVLNSDGTVSYRVVTLGVRNGKEYEILSGLEEGETVVTSGQAAIRDGIKVSVVSE